MYDLNSHTNVPLHVLPVDLLIVIFNDAITKCYMYDRYPRDRDPTSIPIQECYRYFSLGYSDQPRREYGELIKLTRVCSYWRRIIVGTPTFWNRIHFPARDEQLLELHLRRAQSTPLDVSVYLNDTAGLDPIVQKFLSENTHRIERFCVLSKLLDHKENYSFTDPFPPSRLKYLFVEGFVYGLALNVNFSSFPDQSSIGVEEISLHNVSPVVDMTVFKSVVRLQITSGDYTRPKAGWPLSTVLQLLSYCQNTIEEVKVDVTPSPSLGINRMLSNKLIHLLRLRRLEYTDKGDEEIPSNLLQYICAPHVLTLHVASFASQLGQGSSGFLPSTFTQLSQRKPALLEIYRPIPQCHFGLNLYADPGRHRKVFAFRFVLPLQRRQGLEDTLSKALLSIAELHSLLSVEYLRVTKDCVKITGPLRNFIEKHPGFKRTDTVDKEPRSLPYY